MKSISQRCCCVLCLYIILVSQTQYSTLYLLFTEDPVPYNYHRIQPANNINNQRYNPSLINHWEFLIVAIYFNIVLLFFIFVSQFNIIFVWFLTLVDGIFLPSFLFYFNGKLRQFYQRKFWENAPSYLQRFNPDYVIEINNSDNNIELGPLPQNRYCKKSHARPRKKRTRF